MQKSRKIEQKTNWEVKNNIYLMCSEAFLGGTNSEILVHKADGLFFAFLFRNNECHLTSGNIWSCFFRSKVHIWKTSEFMFASIFQLSYPVIATRNIKLFINSVIFVLTELNIFDIIYNILKIKSRIFSASFTVL